MTFGSRDISALPVYAVYPSEVGSRGPNPEVVGQVRALLERDREDASHPHAYERLASAGLAEETVYLRFGDVSDGLRSAISPLGGVNESGMSVFAGMLTRDGHYLVDTPYLDLRADLVGYAHEGQPAYLVRGYAAGRGSDGEPLIRYVDGIEPLPPGALVWADPPSHALEMWNVHRFGKWLEDVPELKHLFPEEEDE